MWNEESNYTDGQLTLNLPIHPENSIFTQIQIPAKLTLGELFDNIVNFYNNTNVPNVHDVDGMPVKWKEMIYNSKEQYEIERFDLKYKYRDVFVYLKTFG